jgi:hypothetical protein
MRTVGVALGSGWLVAWLVACTGGSGPLPDQGSDQAGQGAGVIGGENGVDDSPTERPSSGESTAPPKLPVMMSVADFDVSCEVDDDCTAVFQGNSCEACFCPNAAINRKDIEEYTSEFAKNRSDCQLGSVDCAECARPSVACNANTKKCGIR